MSQNYNLMNKKYLKLKNYVIFIKYRLPTIDLKVLDHVQMNSVLEIAGDFEKFSTKILKYLTTHFTFIMCFELSHLKPEKVN